MLKNINYEKCLSFIKCQFRPVGQGGTAGEPIRPAITISRLAGTGGYRVASKLAQYLQNHAPGPCEWTVFDRNLIEKVLEDHHLHRRIADFMAEDHRSVIIDSLEEPWASSVILDPREENGRNHIAPCTNGICRYRGPRRQRDHRQAAECLSRPIGGVP